MARLHAKLRLCAVVVAVLGLSGPAMAGECVGYVIGVKPINHYDHAAGRGFLAVRSGPGGGYAQVGEMYLDDEFTVWQRQGDWLYVSCFNGYCETPYWGQPSPEGWAYAKYLSIGGTCP